ncbi:ribulose-phosphate 3-epimerase [Spiroplasma syrphidicola EA-1]|uniref:Ribulose-phosphate 3-epimerase n=1 Tax=Spiroplasma syrphidicola EA-1 TaxID=1276229 RepID=R4U6Y7_9MOLU|nr:ribulose-phosphate 3-epimerase [Spiroplasma syrphidicola]AGM26398.1 ribulose-phosphate 3-epimerase [Spiroplasma syrphidicola EA-1]
MSKFIIAPSILSADFLNLDQELTLIEAGGVKWIHFDVMDGDFVPNLTFGPKILKDITDKHNLFVDCHLMVKIKNSSVEDYLKPFIEAKANAITLHYEALTSEQINEFLALKTKYDLQFGLAIKPSTNVEEILPFLPFLDLVLVMTVEPGFGGQAFIPHAAEKIAHLRKFIDKNKLKTLISVDGGINAQTGKMCQDFGVDILVAGSYLFGHHDLLERLEGLTNGK